MPGPLLALAPIVKALIANGLSTLAGAAISKGQEWVEEKTGLKLDEVQNASPEKLLEFKKIEMQHEEVLLQAQVEGRKVDVQELTALLGDVQSARQMQIAALQQGDLFAKRFVYYLASGWSVFVGLYIIFITFYPIPEANIRFADTVLGFLLGTVVATILNFFLGSSYGSVKSQQFFRDVAEKMRK